MQTFIVLASLAGLYLTFFITESITRGKMDAYFNQEYIYENLTNFLPYLMGYISVLWIVLVISLIKLIHNKEENNERFAVWFIFFGFVAVPLTALTYPFLTVIF
jgi:hypothetical protein